MHLVTKNSHNNIHIVTENSHNNIHIVTENSHNNIHIVTELISRKKTRCNDRFVNTGGC